MGGTKSDLLVPLLETLQRLPINIKSKLLNTLLLDLYEPLFLRLQFLVSPSNPIRSFDQGSRLCVPFYKLLSLCLEFLAASLLLAIQQISAQLSLSPRTFPWPYDLPFFQSTGLYCLLVILSTQVWGQELCPTYIYLSQ